MVKMMIPISMMFLLKSSTNTIILLLMMIIYSLTMSYHFSMKNMNSIMLMDNLSMMMILLTLMSILLILYSSYSFSKITTTIMPILIILMMTFSFSNTFNFYIMFELVLIPTMLLIMMNGKQPERLQASIYLLMYTITASLPLLISIIYMKNPSFMISYILMVKFKLSIMTLLAFLVKTPMYFMHLWLPKAHVEAPLEGSMILAAVLLKLGGYGLIRFMPMWIKSINSMNYWIISISLIGASATSLNCIRQKDLKSLIAYSSVAHMGFMLTGIFTLSLMGMPGAIIMMLAHGLASSALFLLVNDLYMKFHTRNILLFKGLLFLSPNIMFWWFMLMMINMSAPPSINTVSEIMLMSSLISWNINSMMMIFIMSLMTASFSMMMYVNISHNKNNMPPTMQTQQKTFLSMLTHIMPLSMMLMKMEMFTQ